MRSAVKMPLLVGEQEAAILDSESRIANWLYNMLLEIANTLRFSPFPDSQVPAPFKVAGLQTDCLASGTAARANTRLACPSSASRQSKRDA